MEMRPNSQQKEYQAEFRAFVNEEVAPHADRFEREECLPPELIAALARQGYLGATLPEEYGGRGLDAIGYGLLNEELGKGCSSVRGLVMLQAMVAETILKWGSRSQKTRWLNRIAAGETIAALALTEAEAGSDAKSIATTLTPAGDSFVVNGHKKWITFGQNADLFLMFGQLEGKLCAFLLERDTPGFSARPIADIMGVRASMLADLHLRDCRIPQENLVGGIGFGLVPVGLFALNLGRYSVAWGCVGIAQACLEASMQHTASRKQFGVYLKEHQLIRRMITDMLVNIRAARLLCYQAGHLRQQGDPASVMETMVAKYFASTMAVQVAGDALQIHGAVGFSGGHPVQRYFRDAKIMEIIEGTTQIHQLKIAEFGYQQYPPG